MDKDKETDLLRPGDDVFLNRSYPFHDEPVWIMAKVTQVYYHGFYSESDEHGQYYRQWVQENMSWRRKEA